MLYVYIISTLSLIFIIKLYYLPIPSFLSSINNRQEPSPLYKSGWEEDRARRVCDWVWHCAAMSGTDTDTQTTFVSQFQSIYWALNPSYHEAWLLAPPLCSWQLIQCKAVHSDHNTSRDVEDHRLEIMGTLRDIEDHHIWEILRTTTLERY